jgi:hypothetical protein
MTTASNVSSVPIVPSTAIFLPSGMSVSREQRMTHPFGSNSTPSLAPSVKFRSRRIRDACI